MLVSAYISFPGNVPTVTRQDGSWISSITDGGVGIATLNITASTFSVAANYGGALGDDGGGQLQFSSSSTSSVRVDVTQGGSSTDRAFSVIGVGATT